MVEDYFWSNWNLNKLESEGIKSIKKAEELILNKIPKKDLVSIYVGGSFIRREMKPDSDVDLFAVVKKDENLLKLSEINEKGKNYNPVFGVSGYSLNELESGKSNDMHKKVKANPSRFLKKLKHYKLIYGKEVNPEEYSIRSDEEDLKKIVIAFREIFIPKYLNNKFSFDKIINEVFWLVENEQKFKGREVPYSFEGIANSIQDKNHIVHDALELRKNPPKNKKTKEEYIKKLEKYLNYLEEKQSP